MCARAPVCANARINNFEHLGFVIFYYYKCYSFLKWINTVKKKKLISRFKCFQYGKKLIADG